jgi:hypothetical protein
MTTNDNRCCKYNNGGVARLLWKPSGALNILLEKKKEVEFFFFPCGLQSILELLHAMSSMSSTSLDSIHLVANLIECDCVTFVECQEKENSNRKEKSMWIYIFFFKKKGLKNNCQKNSESIIEYKREIGISNISTIHTNYSCF